MTFAELTATQGTPANDIFSSEAAVAPAFAPPTPEPAITPPEGAVPPE
jgi:hypothetical protein